MHNGTQGPYSYGDEVTLLSSHPVYEFTGKEAGYRIEDRKHRGDGTVVGIVPMEFRSDEFFIG